MSTSHPIPPNPHPGPSPWPPPDRPLPASLQGADAVELAELLIAGALSSEESAYAATLLQTGEPNLSRAMRDLEPVARALFSAAATPPPLAKTAVLARVDGDLARRDADEYHTLIDSGALELREPLSTRADRTARQDRGSLRQIGGMTILLAAEQRWKPTGVRGVRFRTLVADRRFNRRTILLQMDPGTELPDHGHAGLEEVLVLSGDLHMGDTPLGPGDYFRVKPGDEHPTPRSKNGCTALVISGYAPFTLASLPRLVWGTITSWFRRA